MKIVGTCLLGLMCSTNALAFELSSPDLPANANMPDQFVFNEYGCTGQNLSPMVKWKDAPDGTKSFALTVFDPDAKKGKGWWHWIVVNIPADQTYFEKGFGKMGEANPQGNIVQVETSFGKPGYGGACPPVGEDPHHYIFTLYALKVSSLPIKSSDSLDKIADLIKHNNLGQASFTVMYGR